MWAGSAKGCEQGHVCVWHIFWLSTHLMEGALQVGAKVMLGDRSVRITLARCWASLSRWARVRFICSLLWGGLFMGGDDLKAQVEQMKVRCPQRDNSLDCVLV